MDTISCPVCSYPLEAPTQEGQQLYCPWCQSISTAISAEIPNTVIVGFACFFAGVLLSPAVYQALQGTGKYLARQAKEKIR